MPDRQSSSEPLPPFTATDFLASPRYWPSLGFGAYLVFCNLAWFAIGEAADPGIGLLLAWWLCGSIGAEFAILPAWLVWSGRPLRQRLLLALLSTLTLFVLWSLSLGHSPWSRFPAAVFLFLPTVAGMVAIPLLLLKFLANWRIGRVDQQKPESPRLGIRHLLAMTTLVAFSLAAARGGMRLFETDGEPSSWLFLGIGAAATFLATVLLVVPVIYLTLRPGRIWHSAVAIGSLAIVLAAVPLVIALSRSPVWPPLIMMLAPFPLVLGFAYTTALPCWMARAAGYRLWTRRT
jgi:hypothetical protein